MPFEVDPAPEIASDRRSGCSRTRSGRVFGREEAVRRKSGCTRMIAWTTRWKKLHALEKKILKELDRVAGGQAPPFFDRTTFVALTPAEQLRLYNHAVLYYSALHALRAAQKTLRFQWADQNDTWMRRCNKVIVAPTNPAQDAVWKACGDDPVKRVRALALFNIEERFHAITEEFARETTPRFSQRSYALVVRAVERILQFSAEF